MTKTEIHELPPCLIFIDKEGHWHHKGAEMIRRDFIRLFYENMEMDSQGLYVINWGGKRCYVDVEDTAFVVWNVAFQENTNGPGTGIVISLSDDSHEDLAPETLHVGEDNVLYCKVKSAAFPARFSRSAYYRLATHIEEQNDGYYLPLNEKRYKIAGV